MELADWAVKNLWVAITALIVIPLATFYREFIKTVAARFAPLALDWFKANSTGKPKNRPQRARVAANRVTGRPGIDVSTWTSAKWDADWKCADVAYLCADSEPGQLPHDDPVVAAWRKRLTSWARSDVRPIDAATELTLDEWMSIVHGICMHSDQPRPPILRYWMAIGELAAED